MSFRSPDAAGSTIREILHGSEESNALPSISTNVINGATSLAPPQTSTHGAQQRDQTSMQVTSDATEAPDRQNVSVEPFTFSPSWQRSEEHEIPAIQDMDTTELCNYLESMGCITETIISLDPPS